MLISSKHCRVKGSQLPFTSVDGHECRGHGRQDRSHPEAHAADNQVAYLEPKAAQRAIESRNSFVDMTGAAAC